MGLPILICITGESKPYAEDKLWQAPLSFYASILYYHFIAPQSHRCGRISMKHLNAFKGLLLTLLLACTSTVSAYDFEVNGIYYTIRTGTEVYVTARNTNSSFNEYEGHINIPETVVYSGVTYNVDGIGSYAFRYSSIESITIPPTITFIGYNAFSYCHVKEVYISDLYAWCNISFDINGGVMDGANLYLNNQLVTELSIPNGITKINNYVFGGCKSIKSVIIPNSVVQINNWAFASCENLANVEIPNSVTSIGSYAFCGCTKLEELDLPQSLTDIGSGAFENCSGLKNMIIPTGVSVIWDKTFRNCTNLATISAHNTITKICEQAFYGCSELENFTIPSGIIEIYESTFAYSGLENIVIPNSVKYISDKAFAYTKLKNVIIPNSVKVIENSAFRGCGALTSIAVDVDNSVYDSRECCNAIIETATNTLIRGCENTTIPNSVTIIEGSAFEGCTGLISIEIPNSVTSIGMWAFSDCNALTDIYFASNPTIKSDALPSTTNRHLRITDSDAAKFNIANANTYSDTSYTLTISEGKYGTIMLPFTPDEASLENYAFYTLKEVGDGYIKFEEVAAPEANTPYLYTLRVGGENTAITGGETTIAADINNGTQDSWELVGSFTKQTIDCTTGNYYAYSAARNEINRITKTLTVNPYRAYLKSTAAQNSNLRVFIGGTTGVTEIFPDDIEDFGNGAIYDLYGRPVDEPTKGDIYIIDGKKVVL